MSMKNFNDFPTVFGERLSSIICEDVSDYLREVKACVTKIIKDLHETQEERDDLQRELDKLRAEKEAMQTDAIRSLRAIPVDFVERFAKSCDTWTEARPFYEMLLEYAAGNRDIKQKATNVKAHHTRRKKSLTKQVYKNCEVVQNIQSKQTRIMNPTFGSMYDIHDNEEVKAG